MRQHTLPVLTVLLAAIVAWYAAAIGLNADQVSARLDGLNPQWTWQDLVAGTWAMERPVLPAPHQVALNWWQSTFATEIDSPRSLVQEQAANRVFAAQAVLARMLASSSNPRT